MSFTGALPSRILAAVKDHVKRVRTLSDLAREANRLIENTQALVRELTAQMEASNSRITKRRRARKTSPRST